MDKETSEKIEEVLNYIRPALQRDGGGIEFVELGEDGIAKVRMLGACVGCPMSDMTMKMFVEAALVDAIDSIKEVIAVE